MSPVINLSEFAAVRSMATLVLVDLHHGVSTGPRESSYQKSAGALVKCRAALRHARSAGLPVAFVRRIDPAATLRQLNRYPRWIEGFEPARSDMVFDRQLPSCYASAEFADMMNHVGGNYVLAGLFGESSCLATAVDAFHRGHRFTYLADASASQPFDDIPGAELHRAVSRIISLYGNVVDTNMWIRTTSRRARGG